ncbi:MAG: lytic transglycosylase domain-containing protein [Candidatus Competibacterales bacterium]
MLKRMALGLSLAAGLGILASAATATETNPLPRFVDAANQRRFAPAIERLAARYQVPAALVHAVVSVESGYNPSAVSTKGAMGLMQLMPATAADYGVDDPFDPEANLRGGIRHLKRLLNKYRNISHALAAYNAGEGNAKRHRRSIPFEETRRYVVQVIQLYQRYLQRLP